MLIDKAYISTRGDYSVGIRPYQVTVSGLEFDTECMDGAVDYLREKLTTCFREIYDEPVCVMFDFEDIALEVQP